MAKHLEKKPQHAGIGEQLADKPDELIGLLISDGEEKEWALEAVANEGPAHKQVYSALLLQRMYELVKKVETLTGSGFEPQPGVKLTSHKDGWEVPVPFVVNGFAKKDAQAIAEVAAHAPAHEIVAFNTLLQGIEWCSSALSESNHDKNKR